MAHWVQGVVVEKQRWNERLYSLRFAADAAAFRAGQFTRLALDVDGERVARPYSLVNAPGQTPLEVYFNRVPNGPLSTRLAELEPGDPLWVAGQPYGFFTLAEVPEARDLWLLATGTGLGVFLSILGTDEPWQRFEHIVLVHGVREQAELTYGERIQSYLAAHPGQFRYLPTTSRQAAAGALHGRIPALMADGRLEQQAGLPIGAATSHLMLCGNPGMIEGMGALLDARGMRRHRRSEPGHYSMEKYH
jgi:ferredoxin--NADP+ reductase